MCALWTFKQKLALKMRVRYGISIVFILMSSYKTLSGYAIHVVILHFYISIYRSISLYLQVVYVLNFYGLIIT